MKKQATLKDTKELPQMTQEDFLERFYDGKISYKLPSKYPENFSLCTSYNDGKKEIPLTNKDKVGAILKDAYNAVKPIVKKFKLSLALLVESNVTYKGVAWTKRIRIDFSTPGKREELIAYTSMIQIKIRNKEFPQNPKKFLNKTTILAILLHELAHTRHMHHKIEFALFLKEMFEHAMTLGIFPPNEEHMIPSSRAWERRMFETKGSMTREELDSFFEAEEANADHSDGEHGHEWEREEVREKEEVKTNEVSKEPLRQNSVKGGKSATNLVNKGEKIAVEQETNKRKVVVNKTTAVKAVNPQRSLKLDKETSSKTNSGMIKVTKNVNSVKEVSNQNKPVQVRNDSVMEIEKENEDIKATLLKAQIEENKADNESNSRSMEVEKS